ncbi:hypothetical protein F0562_003459 [Nyssa sinensis]|uniref:Uncharacterized protein n=1 Tax=Nyssa sinensis TaxID=561372 RepID=A0A5J5BYL5_9ASTE|nr:hypothetical protein F0562_003459 [Nyssa sinensis]
MEVLPQAVQQEFMRVGVVDEGRATSFNLGHGSVVAEGATAKARSGSWRNPMFRSKVDGFWLGCIGGESQCKETKMQRKKRAANSVFAGSSALQGVNHVGHIDRWMDDVLGVVNSGARNFFGSVDSRSKDAIDQITANGAVVAAAVEAIVARLATAVTM